VARIAIAGASGFVGRSLIEALRRTHSVKALGRTSSASARPGVEWRETDLFSFRSALAALSDIDVAIYLVHSMMPSSRLFQGSFHDTDLLLADNFAHACKKNGVKRIVYLGGLAPEGYVSPHLQSRMEVEGVLRSSGIPVTVLRAGMIVGPGGSSFEILRSLVQKLPVMILPRWTQSRTQAVFIDDVIEVIKVAAEKDVLEGKTVDLVNGEPLTYQTILKSAASAMGLRRWMLPVPIASTGFSKLWVQIFGNSTYELVSPLIDSLLCDLPQMKPSDQIAPLIRYHRFETMLLETMKREPGAQPRLRRRVNRADSVRSVQRLPAVPQNCDWIAGEYLRWLPSIFRTVVTVRTLAGADRVGFFLTGMASPLLVLESAREAQGLSRAKFNIVGGLLTKTSDTGWLEFRQIDDKRYTLASIHEFVPRLPWPVYVCTQAPLHRLVMFLFGKHLAASAEGPPEPRN
jgi:uncharacterized protein YbjT (DUF2867 family)